VTKKTAAKRATTGRSTPATRSKATATKSTTTRRARPAPKPREVSVGTDATFATGSAAPRRRLKNISEVRHFFRTNDVPILFFGAASQSTGGKALPLGSPLIPNWNRVTSAVPEFMEMLHGAVEEDNK